MLTTRSPSPTHEWPSYSMADVISGRKLVQSKQRFPEDYDKVFVSIIWARSVKMYFTRQDIYRMAKAGRIREYGHIFPDAKSFQRSIMDSPHPLFLRDDLKILSAHNKEGVRKKIKTEEEFKNPDMRNRREFLKKLHRTCRNDPRVVMETKSPVWYAEKISHFGRTKDLDVHTKNYLLLISETYEVLFNVRTRYGLEKKQIWKLWTQFRECLISKEELYLGIELRRLSRSNQVRVGALRRAEIQDLDAINESLMNYEIMRNRLIEQMNYVHEASRSQS